ncbi:hypothetical protein EXIGLDRAFT_753900 [Exidia glandulosa HHB12029]|uniref:Chitinase n=1 Tax=Exidia glandulosa HHB12029 TaxID=1314781 RepID=A0A165DEP0_EXIGL|nr:hypothetical protein EXIGLDRAFT_753900 [Exidia glandulosa HHB12029]
MATTGNAAQHLLFGILDVNGATGTPFTLSLSDVPDQWDVIFVERATQDASGTIAFEVCGPSDSSCSAQDFPAAVKDKTSKGRIVQLNISVNPNAVDPNASWSDQEFVDSAGSQVDQNGFNGVNIDLIGLGKDEADDCTSITSRVSGVVTILRSKYGAQFALSIRVVLWPDDSGILQGNKCNVAILSPALRDLLTFVYVIAPGWISAPYKDVNGATQHTDPQNFMPVLVDDLLHLGNSQNLKLLRPEQLVIDTTGMFAGSWPDEQPYWRTAENVQSAMTCVIRGEGPGCAVYKPQEGGWTTWQGITGLPINVDHKLGDPYAKSMRTYLDALANDPPVSGQPTASTPTSGGATSPLAATPQHSSDNAAPAASTALPLQDKGESSASHSGVALPIILIAVIVPILVAILILALLIWYRRRRNYGTQAPHEDDMSHPSFAPQPYTYSTTRSVTHPGSIHTTTWILRTN